jgi:hypothetical protein
LAISPANPNSFDAREWAEAFTAEHPEVDEYVAGLWFHNAITAGYWASENGLLLHETDPPSA